MEKSWNLLGHGKVLEIRLGHGKVVKFDSSK